MSIHHFRISKEGLAFEISVDGGDVLVKPLYEGNSFTDLYDTMAEAQRLVSKSILLSNPGNPYTSLVLYYSNKGWLVQDCD